MVDDGRHRTTPDELAAQISDLSPMAVVLVGRDGTIRFANQALRELTGFDGDLVGVDWADRFVAEHDRERVRARLAGLRPGDERSGWVRVILTASGERYAEWWDRVVVDADGEVVGLLAVGQDVTERIDAEIELARTARQLREAQRITGVGVGSRHARSGRVDFSDEVFAIFEVDHVDDRNVFEQLLARVHEDDRERARSSFYSLGRDVDTAVFEGRLAMDDGRVKYVRWTATRVDGDDGPDVFVGVVQDLSEFRETEAELKQMRDQMEDAQELARVGSWTFDLATGELTWSRQLFRIFGMDPDHDRASGDAIRAVTHPDDLHLVEEASRRTRAGADPFEIVHRLRPPDGDVRWVRVRGRMELGDDGAPVRVLGTVQDVTESQSAEDELRRTRDQLAEAQELAQFGSWSLDLVSNEISWSPGIYRIFEFDRERHPDPDGILDRTHPDDRALVLAASERSLARREPEEVDYRLLLPDGRVRWVRMRGRHEHAPDGQAVRSHGTVQDITESVEAARRLSWAGQQLEKAQRLAQIGSWTLDLVSGELTWSDEIYRIFEIDPGQFEATYEAFLEVTHPEDRELIDLEYQSWVANRSEYDLVHRLLMPDGRIKYVRERGRTEYAGDGTALRSIGTVQDVTAVALAQREVETLNTDLETRIEQRTAELVNARDEAEAANRAKDLFLASMSHEMRTPLNAVLAYAQLLELDDRLPTDLAAHIGEIREAGHHLLTLVSDVLDLAKVESGRVALEIRQVQLERAVEACLSQLAPLASHHGVGVTASPTLRRLWVLADAVRLRQVLTNLVSNGIKYNRPGGSVTIDAEVAAGGRVRISVADTGRGVPGDRIEEMFEPFVRLGQERGRVEGSGIGLSISRRLVESMDGRITVTRTSDAGSTFTVEMPGGELGSPPPAVGGAPAARQ